MAAPSGSKAFVYNNRLYVTSPTGNATGCPTGTSWDTKNCTLNLVPPNNMGFAYDNKLYIKRSCDMPNWPPLVLNIIGVKIKVKKDHAFAFKDEVSYVANMHDRVNCGNNQPLTLPAFEKVSNAQLNTWRTGQWSLAPTTQMIKPNQVIDLVLYEKDSCGSGCQQSYGASNCPKLYYVSKQSAYGVISIPYADFVGPSFNPGTKMVREYNLGDAELRVEGLVW